MSDPAAWPDPLPTTVAGLAEVLHLEMRLLEQHLDVALRHLTNAEVEAENEDGVAVVVDDNLMWLVERLRELTGTAAGAWSLARMMEQQHRIESRGNVDATSSSSSSTG